MGESFKLDHNKDADHVKVSFPFDRTTVQSFRKEFPRARWSDWHKAWIVPGKTARRRTDRWIAHEESRAKPFAEDKGRDAYEFEPILSSYLSIDRKGFRIKTPYSPKLVEEIRQLPFARWDESARIWRIPFASYEELLKHWRAIENEAKRCEPEERRKRAEARKGSDADIKARRHARERRRRRVPLPAEALPPLNRPIATLAYGIIVIIEITGELVRSELIEDIYSDLDGDYVWGIWRLPSLDELVQTWPAKKELTADVCRRSWWQPNLQQLREARRTARSRERGATSLQKS